MREPDAPDRDLPPDPVGAVVSASSPAQGPALAALAGRDWDPQAYLAFDRHRLQPALDLIARLPDTLGEATPAGESGRAPRIVDLGCGTGRVSVHLLRRWPKAALRGVDHSPQMLEAARAREAAGELLAGGGLHWEAADIASWTADAPVDLIFANASLHWVEDHATVLPRLMQQLAPGGWLAVQMPLSWDLPSHRLMRELLDAPASDGAPFGNAELRAAMTEPWVAPPERYFDWLQPSSGRLDIWHSEYLQALEGEAPVLAWVRASGLRPILAALPEPRRSEYLARYRAALDAAYPRRADGRTFYPFRRLFVLAQRS